MPDTFECSGLRGVPGGVAVNGEVGGREWRFVYRDDTWRLEVGPLWRSMGEQPAWFREGCIRSASDCKTGYGHSGPAWDARPWSFDAIVDVLDSALMGCAMQTGWFSTCWSPSDILSGTNARPRSNTPQTDTVIASPRDTGSDVPTVPPTETKGAESMSETTKTTSATAGAKPAETTTDKAMAVLKQGADESIDGAWRGAAEIAAEQSRDYLVGKLKKSETMPDIADAVARFLATAWGLAVWSFVLGCILPHVAAYVPKVGNKPQFARLARELRVEGFKGAFRGLATQIAAIVSSALEVVGLLEAATADVDDPSAG